MGRDRLYKRHSFVDDNILFEFAKGNRKCATEAESLLWERLRGGLLGVRFRRQHVIGRYIADFACLSHRLIVEIDGIYHYYDKQIDKDFERTKYLESLGLTELRFDNEEVINDIDSVVNKIKNYILKELPIDR